MVYFPVMLGFENKALVPYIALSMGGTTLASLIVQNAESPKSLEIQCMTVQLRDGLQILHETAGLIRVSVSCNLTCNQKKYCHFNT